MGFLSSLLRGGAALLGRGVSALGGLFRTPAVRGIATIAGGTAIGTGLAGLFGGDGAAAEDEGAMGRRTRTIVQTVNAEGQVVKQRVLRGSPFLMRRDFIIAKRVLRTASKLGRFSKRTITPSKMKMFTDAVIDNALRTQLQLPCPTS